MACCMNMDLRSSFSTLTNGVATTAVVQCRAAFPIVSRVSVAPRCSALRRVVYIRPIHTRSDSFCENLSLAFATPDLGLAFKLVCILKGRRQKSRHNGGERREGERIVGPCFVSRRGTATGKCW